MVEDVVVKKSTFAISSPDEFLIFSLSLRGRAICRDLEEETIDFVGNPEPTNYHRQGGKEVMFSSFLSVCLSVC